jgi:23S rRNA G2445 N2-methylase RlmL
VTLQKHENFQFLIICLPGLENILANELSNILTHNEQDITPMNIITGGIELELPLNIGLALNYSLKSATRILLRVHSSKCRDLPRLYKKLLNIKWKDYCWPVYNFKISTSKSRLINTKKIEQTAQDALEKYFNGNDFKKLQIKHAASNKLKTDIYIRIDNDNLVVSVDTSGERLDKRENTKSDFSIASIRNSIAYSQITDIISLLISDTYNLYDPFCGSGTYLKEAIQYSSYSDRVFCLIPSLHTVKKLNNIIKNSFNDISGSDITPIKNIKLNIDKKDALKPLNLMSKTVVVTNPPYGKRVEDKKKRDLTAGQFINDFILNCLNEENLIGLSLITPRDFDFKKDIKGFKYFEGIKLKNGGIPVVNHIFLRPNFIC